MYVSQVGLLLICLTLDTSGVLKCSYTLTVRVVITLRLLGHTSLATLTSTQAAGELSLVFTIDLLNSFCLLLDK